MLVTCVSYEYVITTDIHCPGTTTASVLITSLDMTKTRQRGTFEYDVMVSEIVSGLSDDVKCVASKITCDLSIYASPKRKIITIVNPPLVATFQARGPAFRNCDNERLNVTCP
jgi:hypothetical protein